MAWNSKKRDNNGSALDLNAPNPILDNEDGIVRSEVSADAAPAGEQDEQTVRGSSHLSSFWAQSSPLDTSAFSVTGPAVQAPAAPVAPAAAFAPLPINVDPGQPAAVAAPANAAAPAAAPDADGMDTMAAGQPRIEAMTVGTTEEPHIESYTISNGKWGASSTVGTAGGTVTWSVVDAGKTNSLTGFFSGSTVALTSFLPSNYDTLIANAFAAWSAVANITFSKVTDGGQNIGGASATGNIRISGAAIDNAGTKVANTIIPASGQTTATQASEAGDIVFDKDEGLFWTEANFYNVVLHEIGHALGLSHSSVTNSVMNATYDSTMSALKADDVAGIQALYGAKVDASLVDLSVSSATLASSTVTAGTNLNLTYVVKNTGGAALSTSALWASFTIDGEPTPTKQTGWDYMKSSSLVATTGSQTFNFANVSTAGLSAGAHTITVFADASNGLLEGDETNNKKTITFTVTDAPKPDLQVTSITPGATTVTEGQNLTFSYVVKNTGTVAAGATWSGIKIDADPTKTVYTEWNPVAGLASNATVTLSNTISTTGLAAGAHTLRISADTGAQIDEGTTGETNNLTYLTFTVAAQGAKPDLVVSNITLGATTVGKGADLAFNYTVKNQGTVDATAASWAGVYVDTNPSAADFLVWNNTNKLAAGATQTLTNTISTASLSEGVHTLRIGADLGLQVAEANETNNVALVTFTVGPAVKADLVVDSITPVSATVSQGSDLTFTYVVKNNGVLNNSVNTWSGIKIDGAPTKTSYTAWDTILPVAAGGSRSQISTVSTAGLSVGNHTLQISADTGEVVGESDETNNLKVITFSVAAPSKADLSIASIALGKTSVTQGELLSFDYVLKNGGLADDKIQTWSAYRVDSAPTKTLFNEWDWNGPLGAGATKTYSSKIATSSLSVGTHVLNISADMGATLAESDETNNTLTSVTFTVNAAPRPDLIIDSITPATLSIEQGKALTFNYVVKNASATIDALTGSWAGFLIDGNVTKTLYTGWNNVGPIGATKTAAFNNAIDTKSLSVGAHTLRFLADAGEQVLETDDGNNTGSITFMVTAPARPDLVIDSVTAGASVAQGEKFNFTYTVKNTGTVNDPISTWAAARVDGEPTATTYGAWNWIDPLAASTTSKVHSNYIDTTSLSEGMHVLQLKADTGGDLAEDSETNNVTLVTFSVSAGIKADLEVSSLSVPTSVAQGEDLKFDYTVKNAGSKDAGMSWASVRIDSAPTIASYNAWNWIDPLVASTGNKTVSNKVSTVGLSEGVHTLWFNADTGGSIAESDESDNTVKVSFTVTAPARPDLVIDSITPAVTTIAQGETLSFEYVLKNKGTAAATQTTWAGAKVDGDPTKSDYTSWNYANTLAAGATQTLKSTISTAGLSKGEHVLKVGADLGLGQLESNELNNITAVTFTVGAPIKADLQVVSIAPAVTTIAQGENLAFDYVVKNIGSAAAGTSWSGIKFDANPTGTAYTAWNPIAGLAANDQVKASNVLSTSGLSVGVHTLRIGTDSGGSVSESDEGNNITTVTFTVTAPPRPDLVVDSVTLGSSKVVTGTTLTFDYVVKNIGTADDKLTTWSAIKIDGAPTSSSYNTWKYNDATIAVGASQTRSASVSTTGLSLGTHTLFFAADMGGQLTELDETNNGKSVTFTVYDPTKANLVIDSITPATSSVMQGDTLSFDYVVKNIGAASAAASSAGYLADAVPTAGTATFGTVDALAAGATKTLSGTIDTTGFSVGTHTIQIAADITGLVAEGDETDNLLTVSFTVTPAALTLPANWSNAYQSGLSNASDASLMSGPSGGSASSASQDAGWQNPMLSADQSGGWCNESNRLAA